MVFLRSQCCRRRSVTGALAALALSPLFLLALAGCGDKATPAASPAAGASAPAPVGTPPPEVQIGPPGQPRPKL